MFAFFNKNDPADNTDVQLDPERIPAHVAIIMDGNGRWAKARHLPRVAITVILSNRLWPCQDVIKIQNESSQHMES